MKSTFDTDSILFNLLKNSAVTGTNGINGNIYVDDDRPDDSRAEDIVVNSIDLTQDAPPQIGRSNVNIYVADKLLNIAGKEQLKADRVRLAKLTELVVTALRSALVTGLALTVEQQTVIAEPSIKQHFSNIRISWNILN